TEDREGPNERAGPRGKDALCQRRRRVGEEPRQRVDDAVERLVGDGLALVAAPLEDDGFARDRRGEVSREEALSHAGLAEDEDRGETARARVERGSQRALLSRPSHEGRDDRRRRDRDVARAAARARE